MFVLAERVGSTVHLGGGKNNLQDYKQQKGMNPTSKGSWCNVTDRHLIDRCTSCATRTTIAHLNRW